MKGAEMSKPVENVESVADDAAVKPEPSTKTVAAKVSPELHAWLEEQRWAARKSLSGFVGVILEDYARANGFQG